MEEIRGDAGVAVRCVLPDPPRTPQEGAALAMWLIDAPDQSPAWHHYMVSIVHLRPINGEEAVFRIHGATHEMILCAVDSGANPTAYDPETWHHLSPINAMCQFIVGDDEQAVRLGIGCVRAIVNGRLPAEPAFQRQGQQLWQHAVTRTAEHIRTGTHASDSAETV